MTEAFVETGGKGGQSFGMCGMRVCLILMGDKLLAAKGNPAVQDRNVKGHSCIQVPALYVLSLHCGHI